MAEIKTLKQGETQVLPRTVANAVNTDSGLSVQAELDALKESTPDVSAQINEHNVAEDAHANRFANYLPLSGGTITGELNFNGDLTSIITNGDAGETLRISNVYNYIDFGDWSSGNRRGGLNLSSDDAIILTAQNLDTTNKDNYIFLNTNSVRVKPEGYFYGEYVPTLDEELVNKKYVDNAIAAIPTPDVSAQIEAHNTSETAHANMHWLTADDEMLSSIDPDGSIDADTLEGHPASDFVLKSELASLVPAPDLSKYYTKEEVDAKITQIQQLIDQAAALVDEINGEVI